MEFQHIGTERVDPLPYNNGMLPDDLNANILLIEKGHPSNLPLVYRCQHDDLKDLQENTLFFDREEFSLLGEAMEIDKQKKRILLKAGNSVSYQYLITISAPNFLVGIEQQREFSAAIYSLIDALRMKGRVHAPSTAEASAGSVALLHELRPHAEEATIPDYVSQAITPSGKGISSCTIGKCLFEFQL